MQALETSAPTVARAIQQSNDLLMRITKGWGSRARVKRDEIALDFDHERPDFLESLLPFHNHPSYEKLDAELKRQILSCGWLIYNEKTVAIELDIINPACQDILHESIPGLDDELSKEAVCETMVDESYHVLMVKNANRVTREQRGLQHIRVPQFGLVRQMQIEQQKYQAAWASMLVRLSTAVVSEIFISDYLNQLSSDTTIQPLNQTTVAAHRHDELAHAKVFAALTRNFYRAFSGSQKSFFAEMLPKSVCWFADRELSLWGDVLQQLGVPGAAEMIKDCQTFDSIALDRVDYTGVVKLAEEVGIFDSQEGRSAFARAGLI